MRRLKAFHGTQDDGDAQPELPFEMLDKIYSYFEALSLCILSMTCKQMSNRRPHKRDLELALKLRAKERLLQRLDGYSHGLAKALTSVLQEGFNYMTGEFLSHCLIQSLNTNSVDIVSILPVVRGMPMDQNYVGIFSSHLVKNAIDRQGSEWSMTDNDQLTEELRQGGVLKCYHVRVCELTIRILVLDGYDFLKEKKISIQSILKRLYRFSPFECCYDGESFCVNEMTDKMNKIGKTRHKFLENKLRALEDNYDILDDPSHPYSLQRIQKENAELMAQARSSLANVISRYKALGYHIEDK